MKLRASLLLLFGLVSLTLAQNVPYRLPHVYAIKDAKIVTMAGPVIEKGVIVIRDGVIAAVGANATIPSEADVIDGAGLTVYPGFIDCNAPIGLPPAGDAAYSALDRGNVHPNPRVRPERNASDFFAIDEAAFSARRRQGFTTVLIVPSGGSFAGSGVVVNLSSDSPDAAVLRSSFGSFLALRPAQPTAPTEVRSQYPNSLMGGIALIRQSLLDAQHQNEVWRMYERDPLNKPRPAINASLSALQPVLSRQTPMIVRADDDQDILRAQRLANEFGFETIMLGGNRAAYVADTLAGKKIPTILGLRNPENLRLYDPDMPPSLTTFRDRSLAVQNAAILHEKGAPFVFGADTNPGDFWTALRAAVTNGLPKEAALEALTVRAANLLGLGDRIGTLEPGKVANLTIVEGDLFDERGRISRLFVDGKPMSIDAPAAPAIRPGQGGRGGGGRRPPVEDLQTELQSCCREEENYYTSGAHLEHLHESFDEEQPPAERREGSRAEPLPKLNLDRIAPTPDGHNSYVLRGATVWTLTKSGIMADTDVLIENGSIKAVGKNLSAPRTAREINARGMHLTPGVIDCHSHTAISGGVNEGTNVVTAEVRIRDVVNPNDVNIYRQLAGGVTAANLLHGSANVIGGQNATIKMRWGKTADEIMFKEAPEGIKFALGENVKRSNFNEIITTGQQPRYPTTRMGVEQTVRERFMSALDYKRQQEEFRAGRRAFPPKRDLQLDAIVEILDGKRLIHCHSYRQDEILMLIRVCDEFGVKIKTFQHVLEGYKVADEMAAHGVGGSTFSDWWAYKVEAFDAIPHNGALMTARGVNVSFNSDSSELARRLNLDAAKGVKYGGMDEQEALKLVTLNPAIQLGVDKYVGTVEPGKQADLALWTGHPLDSMTRCEMTFVDGVRYFDRTTDLEFRKKLDEERETYLKQLRPSPYGQAAAAQPEQPSESRSSIAGQWSGKLSGAEFLPPEGATLSMTVTVGADGSITGVSKTDMGDAPITGGTFNAATGEVSLKIAVPGLSEVTMNGRVRGRTMTGTIAIMGQTVNVNLTKDDEENQILHASHEAELKTKVEISPRYDASKTKTLKTKGRMLITNAEIHTMAGPVIKNGSILIEDGKIAAINPNRPNVETVYDAKGKRVYPGMIDGLTTLGITEIGSITATNDTSETGQFNPNARVEIALNPDSTAIPVARANGVTTAIVAPSGGIISGQGCVVNLDGWTWEDLCLKGPIGQFVNFNGPSSSITGAADSRKSDFENSIKPLDEFIENARRYLKANGANRPLAERDPRFEAMAPILDGRLPLFLRLNSPTAARAAVQWAEKQNVRIAFVGGSELWRVADLLKEHDVPVILSKTHALPAGEDRPYDEPFTIPAKLHQAGVTFCFSTGASSDVRNLPYQAAMAASFGLPKEVALRALTIDAAKIFGLEDRIGSIEVGKDANLFICDGDPLDIRTNVVQTIIEGRMCDMSNKHTQLYDKYRSRPK